MNGVIKKWKKGVIRQNIVGTHVETQLVKIEKGGKKIGDREEIEPQDGQYTLQPGGYIVIF